MSKGEKEEQFGRRTEASAQARLLRPDDPILSRLPVLSGETVQTGDKEIARARLTRCQADSICTSGALASASQASPR